MIAYRCDRCNKYFIEYEIPHQRSRIVAGAYKYNSDGNRRDIDICPECYRSLEEWMEKGGVKSDKEDH